MEHKHFVTFEQEIMSFPCYESSLYYRFNSKEELSILRIDRSIVDKNDLTEGTILFPVNPTLTNEISILREFLTDMFSYSGNCYGWPYFTKSELITEDDFNQILNQGLENIKSNKNKIIKIGQDDPLIIYCAEKNLYPEPVDHSPHSWQANCPSGWQHHIMISTSSPPNHAWGCGYCKKKGGLEQLKEWVEKK